MQKKPHAAVKLVVGLGALTLFWVIAFMAGVTKARQLGVESVKPTDCSIPVATAMGQARDETAADIADYIVGGCVGTGEFQVGAMTFMCLPKQEM